MKIKFFNHACFSIENDQVILLNDPYLSGTAFNDGWDLIVNDIEFNFDTKKNFFIYYSHEHPDHFSIPFLKSINLEIRKNITILFQETKDKRVKSFLEKDGYNVKELSNKIKYEFHKNFFVTVGQVPFYDSWAIFEIEGQKILNANDCILESPERIYDIKNTVEQIDILFTQFSYANWVEGGLVNKKYRKILAEEKLHRIKMQSDILNPKFIVPFASMVRFCHEENSYMNDSINSPEMAVKFINEFTNSNPYLMVPYESWDGFNKKDNEDAIDFWNKAYEIALNRDLIKQKKTFSISELKKVCDKMRERVFQKNNKIIMSAMSFLKILPKLHIKIKDLDKIITFSWTNGLVEDNNLGTRQCLEMNSESVNFLFKFDFGIDTLNVNARFSGSLTHKKKLIKSFAPVALNNTGRYITISGIFSMLLEPNFMKQGLRTAGLIR